MRLEPDLWLADMLGRQVFRLTVEDWAETHAWSGKALLSLVRSADATQAFYYAKIPVHLILAVNILTEAGFAVVDASLTFEREPTRTTWLEADAKITVRESLPEDEPELTVITRSAFRYSRFHLDPQIGTVLASRIKEEWVRNYVRGARGAGLLTAVQEGKPVGFLAVLARQVPEGYSERIIDLIAVEPRRQGLGVANHLVSHFINDSHGRCEKLAVGTQAANIPSVNLYLKSGFRFAQAAYVLHAHSINGELLRPGSCNQ